jgi:IS30 family transposase
MPARLPAYYFFNFVYMACMIDMRRRGMEAEMSVKHAHLTEDERYSIKHGLDRGDSFKAIARDIGKDCTTISKEIKNRRVFERKGCLGQAFNDCVNRFGCTAGGLCPDRRCRGKSCRTCTKRRCFDMCADYKREFCELLKRAPYVCNHCPNRKRCTLEKATYMPVTAQNEYKQTLRCSRSGFAIDEEEVERIDAIVTPLLRKGHSLHNICVNNVDRVMLSERTMYNYVGGSLFRARNIDMPRSVRFRKRRMKKAFRVDKACYTGRTYADYLTYCVEHPGVGVVEMDTVHGRMGGKAILTLHFVDLHCMLMILIGELTSRAVTDAFVSLRHTLGTELFTKLFHVILTDRGSEFSDPKAIEYDEEGEGLSHVFYCDAQQSQQKGAAENNHSMLRRIVPKGTSFDLFEQSDVTNIMNNVNSYGRPSLNDRSPYSIFVSTFGDEALKKLGAEIIPPDNVILNPTLIRK